MDASGDLSLKISILTDKSPKGEAYATVEVLRLMMMNLILLVLDLNHSIDLIDFSFSSSSRQLLYRWRGLGRSEIRSCVRVAER